MSADIKITGLKELDKKMRELPKKVAKKVVKQSVTAAAKSVVLKQVKQSARRLVGGKMGALIAKNLVFKGYKKQYKGQWAGFIWISPKGNSDFVHITKSTDPKGKAIRHYIPSAIEFGHGNVAAIPFQRKVYKKTVGPARDRVADELIDRTIKEFNKK